MSLLRIAEHSLPENDLKIVPGMEYRKKPCETNSGAVAWYLPAGHLVENLYVRSSEATMHISQEISSTIHGKREYICRLALFHVPPLSPSADSLTPVPIALAKGGELKHAKLEAPFRGEQGTSSNNIIRFSFSSLRLSIP